MSSWSTFIFKSVDGLFVLWTVQLHGTLHFLSQNIKVNLITNDMVFYMKYNTCISTNLSIPLLKHHHAFSICSRSSETGQPQARCMWACRRRSSSQAEYHILTASVRNGCTLQKSQSWQRAALVKLLFVMLDCMQAKLWRMYTVTVEFYFFSKVGTFL